MILAPAHLSSSKILAHYAENEHFPPPISRSLLSAAPCDIEVGQGRGKGLDPRSNFALPRVVQSINVLYLPHLLSELSPCSIVPINQWHSEVTRREMNNGHVSWKGKFNFLYKERYIDERTCTMYRTLHLYSPELPMRRIREPLPLLLEPNVR